MVPLFFAAQFMIACSKRLCFVSRSIIDVYLGDGRNQPSGEEKVRHAREGGHPVWQRRGKDAKPGFPLARERRKGKSISSRRYWTPSASSRGILMLTYRNEMKAFRSYFSFANRHLLLAICYLLVCSCGLSIPRLGKAGRYLEGRDQFLRGRGGDMDKAIAALESVVSEDPAYRDSLTLLARAYYRKGRYQDAYKIIPRALAVNKDDEIAWIILGLTQLRLGDDTKGLETIQSGITLLSRAAVDGYRGFSTWDTRGLVRSSIRRAAFLATKGLEEKEQLIQAVEALLTRMDDEENLRRVEEPRERQRGY